MVIYRNVISYLNLCQCEPKNINISKEICCFGLQHSHHDHDINVLHVNINFLMSTSSVNTSSFYFY
jgi:hypothetical protein